MNCPICDHKINDGVIRCAKCGSALTFWINLNMWAEKAYAAALHALKDGDRGKATELLSRATVSAPENGKYLAAYGRVLAQSGRYAEAAKILEKTCEIAPTDANREALQRATHLAQAAPELVADAVVVGVPLSPDAVGGASGEELRDRQELPSEAGEVPEITFIDAEVRPSDSEQVSSASGPPQPEKSPVSSDESSDGDPPPLAGDGGSASASA